MGWRSYGLTATALAAATVVALAIFSWRRRAAFLAMARGLETLGEGRPARPVQGWFIGSVGRLFRTFNDVAPLLEHRLALLEGDRQLLRAVLQGMTEGVLAVDSRRRLLFANRAACQLFRLRPEAVAARRLVAELIRSPQVQEAIEATLAGDVTHEVEITMPSPSPRNRGQILHLNVHGTPTPGTPTTGAVFVFHDVTDLRRLERMRQDFVANASHELKTPLASIKAYAETLLDGALDDEAVNVRFVQQIDEQADRLHKLILDLLSLARLESGQDPFHHTPTPLLAAVEGCFENHRERARAKGLEYRLVPEGPVEGLQVLADEEAIRQIFDNLIDNAIKYTPQGGQVAVSCRQDGDRVVLAVSDTGIGIPRAELPRVFERFYRADKARSRELGGTGLGLSIVKHLVQSLGGEVSVESHLGVGSTFTVRLPLAEPAPHVGSGLVVEPT